MGKRKWVACSEPGCHWEGNSRPSLKGHMRAAHTGELLGCGFPGCAFGSAWAGSIRNHRREMRHQAPSVLPPPSPCDEPRPSADETTELAPGEAPSAEEDGDTELLGESDLEAELSAAKEEAAIARHKIRKNKSALRKEKERTSSLRAELAAAEALAKAAETALAEAGQGKAQAIAEVEAMAGAHARELRLAQTRLVAVEARRVAMEARAAANAAGTRAVAAQALADAALAHATGGQ
jgi:hypothetical protein